MKLTAIEHNGLRFHTLRITETSKEAEKLARKITKRLRKLSNEHRREILWEVKMAGWEFAIDRMEEFE